MPIYFERRSAWNDYDDGIDRDHLYDCCVGLMTDENSDLNGVNFQLCKNVKNEIIVRVWSVTR